jgi:hypothetical protein
VNFKNSIDLLTSLGINEGENKNAATKKSLNRFNLKNLILYFRKETIGIHPGFFIMSLPQ